MKQIPHYLDVPDYDPAGTRSLIVNTMQRSDEDEFAVTIVGTKTERDGALVELGDDAVILARLRGHQPIRWAKAVTAAAAQARYIQAVYAQLSAMVSMQDDFAVATTMGLRQTFPVSDPKATAPCLFKPILSSTRRVGLIDLSIAGATCGQWEPDDALHHANAVAYSAATAPLDSLYFRLLRKAVEDDDLARRVVMGLSESYDAVGAPFPVAGPDGSRSMF